MITISNEDYRRTVRLLKYLAQGKGQSLREQEYGRQARLLLSKLAKRKKTGK